MSWLRIDAKSELPIFLQIAAQLEDAIFTGIYPEESQVSSTNEIANLLHINPHTVLKGMNCLVEEGILYKKRGRGMFVKKGAMETIRKKRSAAFFETYVESLLKEARKLGIEKEDLIAMIERGYEKEEGGEEHGRNPS